MSHRALVEHFFRHEYGRLVATLARRTGLGQLQAVEDAAQAALVTALETWTTGGVPDDPAAWLFRVAYRKLIGDLRQRANRRSLLDANLDPRPQDVSPPAFFAHEVPDDLLRMLFVCADEAVPPDARLVLALKVVSGFEVREIAVRLFTTEDAVYKRLSRARSRLRRRPPQLDLGAPAALVARRPAVHQVLYLLFTEGHLSSHATLGIRRELCDEAIRLALLLADHPVASSPEGAALLALMHLHRARLGAREDPAGELVLLEDQDRARWDPDDIGHGMRWLAASAEGEAFSRYHAEAAIAAEHALAPSFRETRWDRIAELYALLERGSPSPLHRLNRAVAVAEAEGAAAGLALLEASAVPSWLAGSYQWDAVLADLHRRCAHPEAADRHRRLALASAPSAAVRTLLERRLGRDST